MDDYISRQAVQELIYEQQAFYENERKESDDYGSEMLYVGSLNALTAMEDGLSDITAADVRPVVYGEWETRSDRPDTLICSVCGCGYDMWKHDPHNYCPNCGCYMGGKANG